MHSALILVAVSFPVGLLVGLTGIGGAALMTPILILAFRVPPDLAVGTDLVYGTITKAVGAAVHLRLGHVDFRVVRQLASASVPAGIVGTFVSTHLGRDAQGQLKTAIGIVLILATIALLIQPALAKSATPDANTPKDKTRMDLATFACGLIVGFLLGLTSIGSGSLTLPFLFIAHRMPATRAVGSDILHAAILTGIIATFHAWSGGVQWGLIPWLLVGSIPGVLVGSWMASAFRRSLLRAVLILLIAVFAIKLLS